MLSSEATCVGLASSWRDWHPPVGTFIALLALIGVFFPVIREWRKIRHLERLAWTLCLISLFGLEIRTLYKDRTEHDDQQRLERCRALQSFQGIVEKITVADAKQKAQHTTTLNHVDAVLTKTKLVSALAEANLRKVTGGESFAYVVPVFVPIAEVRKIGMTRVDGFVPAIRNSGPETLTGVTAQIIRQVEPVMENGLIVNFADIKRATNKEMSIGTLPANSQVFFNKRYIPESGASTVTRYSVFITEQNGAIDERLYVRESKDGLSWAYKLEVTTTSFGKVQEYPFRRNKQNLPVVLKTIDWTEPE